MTAGTHFRIARHIPQGTKLGRFHVAEPMSSLALLHRHDGAVLRETDFEPPLAPLDQENLLAQGIHTSHVILGAQDVDALGSCVCNAATAHLSQRLPRQLFEHVTGVADWGDTKTAETYAIRLYHDTTDLTGDPASEWPPTDCGSSGVFVCKQLRGGGTISGWRSALPGPDLLSLLQNGSVIMGTPWFQSWFEPDPQGFVDGDGTASDLQTALASGIAGGHETCICAVENVVVTETGAVDARSTVLRVRNSWGPHWSDHGDFRVHLSTLAMLGTHSDFKQVAA